MGEVILWSVSVVFIIASFCIFKSGEKITLAASLIGVTSLIFNAKGNPIGQALMVVFSFLYGIISYETSYYGEIITYLGMTMPMTVFSMIVWIKNPYKGKKSEVEVNNLSYKEYVFMICLTGIITFVFYFILKYFNTSNMIPSTISVATSFAAVYLTFRRSPYYAIGYTLNDIVLIVLWVMASFENISYVSVIICFIVFLINDIYGFVSWQRMGEKKKTNFNKFVYPLITYEYYKIRK